MALSLQGLRIAAWLAWCTPDQHLCSTGQASALPLDQGGAQAEGLSPSEAVREMDSACKRRERDRERRKRKREQAAAVAVADGTALHVSEVGCAGYTQLQQRSKSHQSLGARTLYQSAILHFSKAVACKIVLGGRNALTGESNVLPSLPCMKPVKPVFRQHGSV